jgi:hypothetical protein
MRNPNERKIDNSKRGHAARDGRWPEVRGSHYWAETLEARRREAQSLASRRLSTGSKSKSTPASMFPSRSCKDNPHSP